MVDGRAAPMDRPVEQWLSQLPQGCCLGERLLDAGEIHLPVEAHELGLSLDVDATLRRIELASAPRSLLTRLRRELSSEPQWTVVRGAYRFDDIEARVLLERLAPALRRAPVDAKLDVAAHRRIHDVPGRELDVEGSLIQLRNQLDQEVIELAFREVPARVRSEDLSDVDVSRVLASYETDFRKKAGKRALNIQRAAELLNGHIIDPGASFSFNRVVGDRTVANGFTWAPVIINDEVEPGVGGGVCQVASTLHAAAVVGGMEVEERRSHSRPSGYAPLGLDATVIYGEVDLKLRNPYAQPVMIHAFLPSEFVIRVELLGADLVGQVRHRHAVLERHDFYRRVVESDELPAGEFKRTQEGGYGYDVTSTVELVNADGMKTNRRYSSTYYPVPEVYKIGPGTSELELPELPEGATHVQLAGLAGDGSVASQGVEVPAN